MSNKSETFTTIQMMKLFQENVKKDIDYTNDTIKIAQDKLRDCDLNLLSLKKFTSELNAGFANIENQVTKLDISFKDINSRNASISSSIDSSDESLSLPNNSKSNTGYFNSFEEIEKSYVVVTISENNDLIVEDGMNWSKRGSISSVDSSCSESN